MTSPHTAIAVTALCPLDTCPVPPVPQHPTMVSLSTTDQLSLTTAMVDQLAMIQQQSLELDELKASMQLIRQELSYYQVTQVNMAHNLQALHSTVQEVAHAMASMTLKLNQFCFPAAQSLPANAPTLQESPHQSSEASLGWPLT